MLLADYCKKTRLWLPWVSGDEENNSLRQSVQRRIAFSRRVRHKGSRQKITHQPPHGVVQYVRLMPYECDHGLSTFRERLI